MSSTGSRSSSARSATNSPPSTSAPRVNRRWLRPGRSSKPSSGPSATSSTPAPPTARHGPTSTASPPARSAWPSASGACAAASTSGATPWPPSPRPRPAATGWPTTGPPWWPWAEEQHPLLDEQAAAAWATAVTVDEERAALVTKIDDFCRGVQIELAGREPLVVAVEELTRAEGQLAALDESLERRAALEGERATAGRAERVARSLGTHLKADHFERWILDEAHDRLLEGATQQLAVLAGGAYSLTVDDRRQFAVIDHANADTVRLARTLSGGETFLVSLALALALADQIAELAAGGAVRLESIFLDEGFGSLDADTLETVATAIEELGAQGRVVGVVTHVRELAERLPVRFEVRKGPGGSTVERVSV